MGVVMVKLTEKLWKIYRAPLRPGMSTIITEIQTVDGETVIPWTAFDDISIRGKRGIAARIVRLHNADLKASLKRALYDLERSCTRSMESGDWGDFTVDQWPELKAARSRGAPMVKRKARRYGKGD
jgi:hypothetical protein